ncbi:putative GTPase [Hartmannibacter diazotrophicus]|uniref:Putative GTPase n=1 Tax=Hartmannibacter diazotrophicus TaxID=1482074 RepID=A0A2C9D3A6_9HYPH|nr:methylmalonyl Co-A mutase-associated GTPase MeaB [Hartmannibacter diazotrophicus]SON54713.1 putative GTPase [Hartmannibacter diazotrophicus]
MAFPLDLDRIRAAGKPGVARALAAIEAKGGLHRHAELLDQAVDAAHGHVLGLTGPPGVGKSTLTNLLAQSARGRGESLGIIAVDPSSQRTGGALLGDRTRFKTDPADKDLFVRSMAARDRLGGLSDHAVAVTVLFAAIYDRVIVESVGIGQSEADVAHVADTVVLCIQPGSGDSLQFMKAGVMELPDIVVVTKADLGAAARRAAADVAGALTLGERRTASWTPPVILVSSTSRSGLDDLERAVREHREYLARTGAGADLKHTRQRHWIEDTIRTNFGRQGLARVDIEAALAASGGPFQAIRELETRLTAYVGTLS